MYIVYIDLKYTYCKYTEMRERVRGILNSFLTNQIFFKKYLFLGIIGKTPAPKVRRRELNKRKISKKTKIQLK